MCVHYRALSEQFSQRHKDFSVYEEGTADRGECGAMEPGTHKKVLKSN